VAELADEAGIGAPVFLMHSGGGIMSVETAADQPVRLLESGPAGGAIFAADMARAHGLDKVLSFDMGGTTAKICLIEDGTPQDRAPFEVARTYRFKKGSGMPISTPVIEMVEIGAGGGSLACRRMGRMRVGPQSAGSEPGPACYGRGGEAPAVTDANLRSGGSTRRISRAGRSRCTPTGRGGAGSALGLMLDEAPSGSPRWWTRTWPMPRASIRSRTARHRAVHHGRLRRRRAAPCLPAVREAGLDEALIPPGAGVGSAIGFLQAPVSFEATRGLYQRLDAFDPEAVNAMLAELAEAANGFVDRGAGNAAPITRLIAQMRYVGRAGKSRSSCRTGPSRGDVPMIVAASRKNTARLFGRVIEGLAVEVTNWQLTVATEVPPVPPGHPVRGGPAAKPVPAHAFLRRRPARDGGGAEVPRSAMTPRVRVDGPAIIVEDETATIVTSAFRAVGQGDGSLRLIRKEATAMKQIDYQIMWDRLIAVVEEQAMTLIRTAFSTSVREAGDLSAGLFDAEARMMAQAVTGTPGHVNAMAESVGHFAARFGPQDTLEGDVYLTNDPWLGTGHLHDITVVTPVFRKGRHIGYFACTAHVVDIGGRGFGPDGREVYEEGLLIPITKFADRRAGPAAADRDDPRQRAHARPDRGRHPFARGLQRGGGTAAARDDGRVRDRRSGGAVSAHILDTSRAGHAGGHRERCRTGLPQRDAWSTATTRPCDMVVTLTVAGDRLTADFAGTSGPSSFGVNVPEVYTRAYACFALKCTIAPEVPNNAGSLEPFEITARRRARSSPRGDPRRSRCGTCWAIWCRTWCWARCTTRCRTRCRRRARRRSGTSRSRCGPLDGPAAAAEILMFNSGGTGARPALDGLSATAFPSGVSTMSVEATEQVGPIIVWRKDLRRARAARGAARRAGQVIEIEARDGLRFPLQRHVRPGGATPRAAARGASPGAPGRVELADGTRLNLQGPAAGRGGAATAPEPAGRRRLRRAEDRGALEVTRDLAAGYITPEQAREHLWTGRRGVRR
jgi:5-oxoprolinase (ATP-hydrolysing)